MRGQQTGLSFILRPFAFSPDVKDVAVVQPPVEDGRGITASLNSYTSDVVNSPSCSSENLTS